MLHTQIQDDEVVEKYVRNQLSPEERSAFEEHFFACDECFENVQTMERFVAGIEDLAQRGELDGVAKSVVWRGAPGRMVWAFAGAFITAVVLGVISAWAYLHRIPELQRQLVAAVTSPRTQRPAEAQLQTVSGLAAVPEANVPVAILQASRGQEVTTATLSTGDRRLIVWMEIGPTRYRSYSMQVDSASGTRITTIDGLTRGPYGALAASLPTELLQPGTFRIKLIGQAPPPASLVSEYRLQIRRP